MDYISSLLSKISEYFDGKGFDSISDAISKYASDFSNLDFPLSWGDGHTIVLGTIIVFVLFFALTALRTAWLGIWLFILSIWIRWSGQEGKALNIWNFKKPVLKNPLSWLNSPYSHLWSEYQDTLHEYETEDSVKEWRATAPAEVFFTPESLVDNRFLVWGEFVRHLPGIITGLGIIGTFSGLIVGLDGFAPSEEASEVRTSLSNLLNGVQQAFLVSAIAITCAIGITIIEKILLAFCYGRVEKINHAIDSLYKTGAGEQYLERLVKADETNVLRTEQLKDALVNDLKDILTDLANNQITAYKETGLHLSQSLNGVKDAVTGQATTETHVIKDAMEDLVSAFIEKMDGSVGGQMQGVKEAMSQSAQAIQDLETVLDRLVSDVGNSTSSAVENVVKQMDEAMQKAANSQAQMTQEVQATIEQLRTQFSTQQASSNDALKSMFEQVLQSMSQGQQDVEGSQERMTEKLSVFMEQLTTQMSDQQTFHDKAMESLLAQLKDGQSQTNSAVTDTVNELSEQLKVVMKSIATTQVDSSNVLHSKLEGVLAAWDVSINKLDHSITQAVTGMNSGAERIEAAAGSFTKAGAKTGEILTGASQTFKYSIDSISNAGTSLKGDLQDGGASLKAAFEHIAPFNREMILASENIGNSVEALNAASTHFQEVGKQTRQQISELQTLMKSIKTEAGMSSEMLRSTQKAVNELQRAVLSLAEAKKQASEYLDQVNKVLVDSFRSFSKEMKDQMVKTVNHSDQHLAQGVGMLRSLAEEQSRLVKRISQRS